MYTRTKKDVEKEIKIIRDFAEELRNDKQKALEFLCRTGIYTPDGKLSKWYR